MARVLVADDDAILRELLAVWLEMAGHTAIHAADGLEALACARAGEADLVISDFMMPRIDGPALVKALRSDAATAHLPVIMLTMRAQADDAAALLDAGADDYVRKPVDWTELRARVDRQIRRAAA